MKTKLRPMTLVLLRGGDCTGAVNVVKNKLDSGVPGSQTGRHNKMIAEQD
jgi:hypothetical protein